MSAPDYVLDGSARILAALLPLYRRTPGSIGDAARYAAYRRQIGVLESDTRAAARSGTLSADLAAITSGYRAAAAEPRAAIAGLERIAIAARAHVPVNAVTATRALQRENEQALCLLVECLALTEIAAAVAGLAPRSYDEARALRLRLGRLFDITIERAAEQHQIDLLRALRTMAGDLARDLIERGRPLARVVGYETAVPLPAVALAHLVYQDAGRADEIAAENATPHPAFMPMSGRVFSR